MTALRAMTSPLRGIDDKMTARQSCAARRVIDGEAEILARSAVIRPLRLALLESPTIHP